MQVGVLVWESLGFWGFPREKLEIMEILEGVKQRDKGLVYIKKRKKRTPRSLLGGKEAYTVQLGRRFLSPWTELLQRQTGGTDTKHIKPDLCFKTDAPKPHFPIATMLDASMSPHTEIQLYGSNLQVNQVLEKEFASWAADHSIDIICANYSYKISLPRKAIEVLAIFHSTVGQEFS